MPSTLERGNSLAPLLAAAVVIHAVIGLWHGAAHSEVPVPLTSAQQVFVGVIVMLAPLVGAGLLWSRWRRSAALLIAAAMLGSLIFGVLNHFVLDSADNVVSIPEHVSRHGFVLSAALIAISETMGTVVAAAAVLVWPRTYQG